MIEQAMFFALGFLVAGLVALAATPAFWRRALRLSRRRLETQVPLSVEEILASRDHLRAEFAVERRRLEIRTAEVTRAHAADRNELGRKGSEIAALKEKIARLTEDVRSGAVALSGAHHEIAGLSNEHGALSAALYDADGLYHSKQEELAALNHAYESLSALADERLTHHAAADARAAGLELRLGEVSRTLAEAETRFTERIDHANRLNDALAVARGNIEVLEGNCAVLQRKLDAETARIAPMTKTLDELREQRDIDQGTLRMLGVKVDIHASALEDAKQRETQIINQRDQQIAKMREAERALNEQHENLRTEFAALQGALDVARRRCQNLESELQQISAARHKRSSNPQTKDGKAASRRGASAKDAALAGAAQPVDETSPTLIISDGEPDEPARFELSRHATN